MFVLYLPEPTVVEAEIRRSVCSVMYVCLRFIDKTAEDVSTKLGRYLLLCVWPLDLHLFSSSEVKITGSVRVQCR